MTNMMLKMKKKSWQIFYYNNRMMYIKIDLFLNFSPSYNQFIMQ